MIDRPDLLPVWALYASSALALAILIPALFTYHWHSLFSNRQAQHFFLAALWRSLCCGICRRVFCPG